MPLGGQGLQAPQNLPVLLPLFSKTGARIKNNLPGSYSPGDEPLAQGKELLEDLSGDVGIDGLGVHGEGGAARVHEDIGHSELGDGLNHVIAQAHPGNIVDDVGSGCDGSSGGFGVEGINRHDDILGG